MPACVGKINDVGFLRSCYRKPQSQTSHQTSSLTSPEPCITLMPPASSTPSIIILLVYIIVELRPTKNKQWFCLKASECLLGGFEEDCTGFICEACLLKNLKSQWDLLCVYGFTPFCLYLMQPSNTHLCVEQTKDAAARPSCAQICNQMKL